MEVNLLTNPNNPKGLAVQFPYSEAAVEKIKTVLGFEWNKSNKLWISQGPEVLLDMERFGIKPGWISPDARSVGEDFRQQLWGSIKARSEPIYEQEYGYQEQGSKFLANLPVALLGDDLGLGKSKQALDAVNLIGAKKVLVLAPKTITYNWLNEIHKWHSEYTAGVVPDEKHNHRKEIDRTRFWKDPPQIVIANYEKLLTADWPYQIEWDVLICDEMSRLKTSTTQTWKNVKRIAIHSDRLWGLTGTPLEIRIPELYSLFRLMRPAVLGNWMRFLTQHCKTDWSGNIVKIENLELLRDRIGYWMLRRTKEEVLNNLPPKIYNEQYIEMTKEEEQEYQVLRDEFEEFLINHEIGGTADPLVQTLRLRQWCCSPALFNIKRQGSKYEALLEIIKENPDKKILVFCYFEQMVSQLSNWLATETDYNQEAFISGNVKSQERIERVIRFNENKLGQIFLSTDAGNQGINLTSVEIVVHYDQLFNPQKMRQREDRTHRIGQKNVVNVIHLLYKDSIDQGMWLLNRERQELFEQVIEGAESLMIRRMNPERWRRVVAGRSIGHD